MGLHNIWTAHQEQRLRELHKQGASYDEMAAALKRSRVAIQVRCKRLGLAITTNPRSLGARAVAQLLGFGCCKRVHALMARGWLEGRNVGTMTRPIRRFTLAQIKAFLAQEQHWYTWRAEDITDVYLRAWAKELRANGPQWLTCAEVGARYAVEGHTVVQWVRKGWLPAQVWNSRYVVRESDLASFTPPQMGGVSGVRASETWRPAPFGRARKLAADVVSPFAQPRNRRRLVDEQVAA